jgi:polysaccharide deacetylase family protein (PEP-CTERM system associated)
MTQLCHLLTVDVEDWPQSTLDHALPIGDRVVANTHAVLDLLAEAGVKATFFVLGKVAEAHPTLTREIAAAGHEIGTHGYSHEAVEAMPIARFQEELHRSVETLRHQAGQPVVGHRAADFSISATSLHLLDHLSAEGLLYDSSIFPIRHPRYGVPGAWRMPHYVRCASGRMLVEFPMATLQVARMVLPVAGGGYLRLFPYWWTRLALHTMERAGLPTTCYLHPYELDVTELDEIPYQVPMQLRWTQSTNRKSVRAKLRRLLTTFRFTTMATACQVLQATPLAVGLDLTRPPVAYTPQPKGGCLCSGNSGAIAFPSYSTTVLCRIKRLWRAILAQK